MKKYVIAFIILILTFFTSMMLVCLFPSSAIKDNVSESADFFYGRGESTVYELKHKIVNVFNFTNALMINNAYSIDADNPLEAMLTVKKNYIPGVTTYVEKTTPKDLRSASKYYNENSKTTDAYQTLELYDTVNENDLYESFEYARYWHGYLVYLRPLLLIFNYNQIEILTTIIFTGLLLINALLITKRLSLKVAIAYVIAYVSIDCFIICKSLNEITCFIISEIMTLIILTEFTDYEIGFANVNLFFFVNGAITNFFDFLTNPIVTYGIPILVYFMLYYKGNKYTVKELMEIYFKTALAWGIGYGLTWVTKWILTDIILHRNIILNAIEQIKFRTTEGNIGLDVLYGRLKFYFSDFTIQMVEIALLVFVVLSHNVKNVKNSLPYVIGFFIPIAWYIVLKEHSTIHAFFTYRNLCISVFALELLIISLGDKIYRKRLEDWQKHLENNVPKKEEKKS